MEQRQLQESGENFFNSVQKPYPDLVNGKINTEQFLEAARDTITMVGRFGKTFSPVMMDMDGNIKKLTKHYLSDPLKNSTIHDMIVAEKAEGKLFAIDALLWFTRGLHYMELFLEKCLEAEDSQNPPENLKEFFLYAYMEALKPYHKWLTQQAFYMAARVSGMTFTRSSFVLALNTSSSPVDFRNDMRNFLNGLRKNRLEIHRLYSEYNLHSTTSV